MLHLSFMSSHSAEMRHRFKSRDFKNSFFTTLFLKRDHFGAFTVLEVYSYYSTSTVSSEFLTNIFSVRVRMGCFLNISPGLTHCRTLFEKIIFTNCYFVVCIYWYNVTCILYLVKYPIITGLIELSTRQSV